jgi:hypothetical protein
MRTMGRRGIVLRGPSPRRLAWRTWTRRIDISFLDVPADQRDHSGAIHLVTLTRHD